MGVVYRACREGDIRPIPRISDLSAAGELKTMDIQYIGEKIFLEEIGVTGEVWVAKGVHKNIYAHELDRTSVSLPVWSKKERVVDFLQNALLVGPKYEPASVPLDTFTNAWLSNKMMAISELQLNPDGKSPRVLCYTSEEFQTTQKAN